MRLWSSLSAHLDTARAEMRLEKILSSLPTSKMCSNGSIAEKLAST